MSIRGGCTYCSLNFINISDGDKEVNLMLIAAHAPHETAPEAIHLLARVITPKRPVRANTQHHVYSEVLYGHWAKAGISHFVRWKTVEDEIASCLTHDKVSESIAIRRYRPQ